MQNSRALFNGLRTITYITPWEKKSRCRRWRFPSDCSYWWNSDFSRSRAGSYSRMQDIASALIDYNLPIQHKSNISVFPDLDLICLNVVWRSGGGCWLLDNLIGIWSKLNVACTHQEKKWGKNGVFKGRACAGNVTIYCVVTKVPPTSAVSLNPNLDEEEIWHLPAV